MTTEDDGPRPFTFRCPWCNEWMVAFMRDFGVKRELVWQISATFETEHDCVTRRR